MEFYDGATLVGYDFTAPYSFSYTPATGGLHNLTAKAYYSNGAVAISVAVGVTFNGVPATMLTPTAGSIFTGNSQTFTWNNVSASQYVIWVGTSFGNNDIVSSLAGTTTATNFTVSTLPTDGTTIYVRLWTAFGSTWLSNDYTFTAAGPPPTAAIMISPANNTVFTGSSQNFTWSNAGASQYVLWVGTSPGNNDIVSSTTGTTTSTNFTVGTLPTGNSPIFVRLWSAFGSTWLYSDYTFTSSP